MITAPIALVLDMLEWIETEPKTYSEVMEAWRTSCPRLTVWEDALDAGLVSVDGGTTVAITPRGRDLLVREGRL